MPKKNVQFIAARTVAKPTRVKFKTKSGETISFKALKTVRERVAVRFVRERRNSLLKEFANGVMIAEGKVEVRWNGPNLHLKRVNENGNQTRKTEESSAEGRGDYVRVLATVFRGRAGKKNQGNPQNSCQDRL